MKPTDYDIDNVLTSRIFYNAFRIRPFVDVGYKNVTRKREGVLVVVLSKSEGSP